MNENAPLKTKLQVSNGYFLKFDQIARLLAAAQNDERARIPQVDLADKLGFARRQIENLSSLAQALGILVPVKLKPTPLGSLIAARDAFFDDLGTLWFLHYSICSEPRFLIWNRFANEFMPRKSTFSYADLRASYADIENTHSQYTARKHVTAETKTILDAYTEQNFSRLAYLRQDGDSYGLSYREAIPPLVLAAMITRYRDRHHPGTTAISIEELLTAPNSPGWVCQIPEDRMRKTLESLKNVPGFSLESRADLDQLRLTSEVEDYQWMERYFTRIE